MSDDIKRDDGYGNAILDLDDKDEAAPQSADSEQSAAQETSKPAKTKAPMDKKAKAVVFIAGAAVLAGAAWGAYMLTQAPASPQQVTAVKAEAEQDPSASESLAADAVFAEQGSQQLRETPLERHGMHAQIDALERRIEGIENTLQQYNQVLTQFNTAMRSLREDLNARPVRSDDWESAGLTSTVELEREMSQMRDEIQVLQRQLQRQSDAADATERRLRELQSNQSQSNASASTSTNRNPANTTTTPTEPARVTGENLHVISAAEGIAFLRRTDINGEPFSLEVGEMLRGWGRVSRVTPFGCIHIGDEIIRPANSAC